MCTEYRDFPYTSCSSTCTASSIINNPSPPIINQSGLGASHELLTLPMLNFHACKMGERLLGRLNEVTHIDTENSAWQVGVAPIGGLLSASRCTLPHAGRGQGRNPSAQRAGARLAEGCAHNRCSIKTAIRQFDKRQRELWHLCPPCVSMELGAVACDFPSPCDHPTWTHSPPNRKGDWPRETKRRRVTPQ